MLFEMLLLLAGGSARREKMGGQGFFFGSDVSGTRLLQVFSQEVGLNSGGTLCSVKGPITILLVLLIQLVLPNCFPVSAEQVLTP